MENMTSRSFGSPTVLAFFLLLVLGVGLLIGFTIRPGEWYGSLYKPFFNPPNWVFAPAWTILYVLIAVAAWRTWVTSGFKQPSGLIWAGQMVLNWLWTPLFFGAHAMLLGLVVVLCLLALIVSFIAVSTDLTARLCFVPYALWVGFASLLNASLLWLNG